MAKKPKEPIKLFNLTDISKAWGMTRGGGHKHFDKGNIEPHQYFHGPEVFWDTIPEKPARKKK